MEKSLSGPATPHSTSGSNTKATPSGQNQKSQFVGLAVTMTWQLAVAILVPIIAGVELDKALDSSPSFAILGFLLASAASVYVMWRTVRSASQLPVPKLTDEQRRAVKKSYEDEDNE